MARSFFFRKKTIWLPRIWLVVMVMIISIICIWLGVKNIAYYLAFNQPKQGSYLVVEGWQDEYSLQQALDVFNKNTYSYLITTGGPDTRHINAEYKTYAEQSAAFLIAQGLDSKKLIIISTPASAQDRTFLSAVMVRDWFASQKHAAVSLDVYTQSVHARRTHTLYKMAFHSNDNIGVYASSPTGFKLEKWWQTSQGAKSVVTELAGILWVKCCFNPGKYGSHQEKWGLVAKD